jgi:hypothetical protein
MFSGKKLKTPEDFLKSSDIKNQRRGFKAGLKSNVINRKEGISVEEFKALNKRKGMGNVRIVRNGFKMSNAMGRKVNFEMPKPKFELGEETLNKFFEITEKDPSDKKWIKQYNEIKRLYPNYTPSQIEALIGRPQRIITRKVNFAQGNLDLREELKLMKSAILQGLESNKDLVEKKIVEMLGQDSIIRELESDIETLNEVIDNVYELARDDTYHELDLPMIVDKATFQNLKSIVLYYILTKSKEVFDREMDKVNVKGIGGKYLKLSSLITLMNDGRYILNLETLTIEDEGRREFLEAINKNALERGLKKMGDRFRDEEEKYESEGEEWTEEEESD